MRAIQRESEKGGRRQVGPRPAHAALMRIDFDLQERLDRLAADGALVGLVPQHLGAVTANPPRGPPNKFDSER